MTNFDRQEIVPDMIATVLAIDFDPLTPSGFRNAVERRNRVPGAKLHGSLGAQFRACVARAPHRVALAFEGGQWSYGHLAHRADVVARRLHALDVGRGDVVALALPRGPWQVAAMLGVLRCGAAYAPLDPRQSPDRLAEQMALLDAGAVVAEEAQVGATWMGEARAVLANGDCAGDDVPLWRDSGQPDDMACLLAVDPEDPRQRMSLNGQACWTTISAVNYLLGLHQEDIVLAAPVLDRALWDLGPLSVGATLVLSAARPSGITVWHSTAQALAVSLEKGGDGLRGVRWALLQDDAMPVALAASLVAAAPACRILRLASTGGALWSAVCDVTEARPDRRALPYGTALPGDQVYVVDERLRARPAWVEGEIVIAGESLAQQLWRNPEMTAARFVTHPRTGQRLYRTEQRGRFLSDGEIEYLDRQPMPVAATPAMSIDRADDEAITATVQSFLMERLNLLEVLPGDRLLTLGANSMLLLDLAAEVQRRHGRQLHVLGLFSNPTVTQVAALTLG